jgi:hypothetical protein
MARKMRIRDLVTYDRDKADFVLATEISEEQFNHAIAMKVGRTSNDPRVQRRALVMALREPIDYAVQFISWTEPFFMRETYGPGEDNKYPLEEGLQPVALQTSHLGQISFNEANFNWTRPAFEQWATGVKFPWKVLERAGWNVSTRMMRRASDALARAIDTAARVVIDAAIVAAGNVSVDAGGILQQATLDAIIKAHETAAQPLVAVHINKGDIVDLATWAAGPLAAGNMPTGVAEEMLRNLHFGNYGGMTWTGNSFVPAGSCYLRGLNSQIGVHQVKGSMRTDSDTDITRGVDFTTIRTADHAWSIIAAYFLHRITC